MKIERKRRHILFRADAKYRALMHHCLRCDACKTDRTKDCPEAARLRQTWQRASQGEDV